MSEISKTPFLYFQFERSNFNIKHAVKKHNSNQSQSSRRLRSISWRLNRIYVIYLYPNVINKNKRQRQMRRNKIGKQNHWKGLCNIRKLEAFSLPDPWTGKIKRSIRKILCRHCCKFFEYNDNSSIGLAQNFRNI